MSINPISVRLLPGFNPTQISGCQLWFDATDTTSIFSDTGGTTQIRPGGSVARWNDKSGNNNYLQQGNAGIRPVYQKTPGGYNAVYFSINGIQLTTINNSPVTGNSGRTVFLIQQTGSITRVGTGPHTGTSPPNTFGIDNNSPIPLLWCPYVYTGADNTIAVTLRTLSEIWAYYDPSVSQVGGNYNFLAAQTRSTTLNTSATPWYFGLRPDGGGSSDSYTCEFIMYNTFLTTSQRQQVEGYLAWKWGLVASLPSDHPYKTVPLIQFPPSAPFPQVSVPRSITLDPIFLPTSISGCQVWLDGADPNANGILPSDTSSVNTWVNKANPGTYNATIASGRTAAVYSTSYKAVNFNSSNNGYVTSYPANPTAETMFVVANNASPSINNNIIIGGQLGARSLGFGFSGNGGTGRHGYLQNEVAWLATTANGSYTSGTTAICTGYVSAGNTFISANGGTFSAGFPINGGAFSGGTTTYLGVDTTTTAYYFVGYAMEILFYNSVLTTNQIQTIQGYLAWKWGIQASLPSDHPYKSINPSPYYDKALLYTNKVIAKSFNPTQISGCALWLDGADTTSIQTSGSSVTQWNDKSGNGYAAVKASFSGGTITLSSQNRLTTVDVGGNVMTIASFPWTTWNTMFFVISTDTWIYSAGTSGSGYQGYTFTGNWLLFVTSAGGNGYLDSVYPLDTQIISVLGLTNQYCIFAIGYGGGTQVSNYTINGTLRYSTTTPGGIAQGTTTTQVNINGNFNTAFGTSRIAEILHYNRELTRIQRQQVEGYLAWKWGIQANLPATHPFKLFPPPPS
jgi:hypothetical protein